MWPIHLVTPMPEFSAVCLINHVINLELSTAQRYLSACPVIMKTVLRQNLSPSSYANLPRSVRSIQNNFSREN